MFQLRKGALADQIIAVSSLADGECMNSAWGGMAARAGVKLYHFPWLVILQLLWVIV